jgi:hypothetical protein
LLLWDKVWTEGCDFLSLEAKFESLAPVEVEFIYSDHVSSTVEYIAEISDMSDMSPTFSPGRNFPLKISRHIRNFESVVTLSLCPAILPMCPDILQYVGLLRFFFGLSARGWGFRGRECLFLVIISFVKCERAREV